MTVPGDDSTRRVDRACDEGARGSAGVNLHSISPCTRLAMTAARASVDHRVALADQDVQIEFSGFPPGETVTVTATQVFRVSRWQAKATFRADAGGRISIARQAPLSGTYTDVSAMGLFWSAERLPDPIARPPDDWILTSWQVHLERSARTARAPGLSSIACCSAPALHGRPGVPTAWWPGYSCRPVKRRALSSCWAAAAVRSTSIGAPCSPRTVMLRSTSPTSTSPACRAAWSTSRWSISRTPSAG